MRFISSLRSKILLLSIFFLGNGAFAQNVGTPPVPKELSAIRQMPASADRIMEFLRHARNPRIIYSDELKSFLEENLKDAKTLNRDDFVSALLSTKAFIELNLGHDEQAVDLIKQAEVYFPKLPEPQAVTLLFDLSRFYNRVGDLQKAIFYHDKMEDFTKDKPKLIMMRVLNLRNRSNLEIKTGNFEKIKQNYSLALSLSKQSNNPSLLKDTRFSYATMLLNFHKEEEAFEILKELIPDLDNMLNERTVRFFEILSENYEKNGDYKNAFTYAEKTFKLAEATTQQKGNSINRMIVLSFLLNDYSNFDSYFVAHKKYGMNMSDLRSKKTYFLAEGRYYDSKNKPALAKANYLKAYGLKLNNQIEPNRDVEILSGLASLYVKDLKNDSASYYLEKAKGIMKKYPLPPATRLFYANALKDLSQQNPKGQDTLIKSLEQQLHLKDTLYQLRISKATTELETKYKVNEKEQELKLAQKQQEVQRLELKQQKQRNWIIFISSAVVVLILAGLAYIFYQRKKQAAILHEATLGNLKQQHRLDLRDTLAEAQEQEKKRIASQLHDEVGAMLSIAKLNINTLGADVFVAGSDASKKLEVAQSLLGDISETVRNISHALMPIALEKYGFKAAVLDLISAIKTANSLTVEHVIEGFEHTEKWPQQFTLSAYRIIQEILNNAIKHAEAKHLFIQLIELENTMTIYIEDDGKGIKQGSSAATGAGMKLLETNIAYLAGKLEIEGKPNEGTFVLIELPIPLIKLS